MLACIENTTSMLHFAVENYFDLGLQHWRVSIRLEQGGSRNHGNSKVFWMKRFFFNYTFSEVQYILSILHVFSEFGVFV